MGQMKNAYTILVRKSKAETIFDIGVDGRIKRDSCPCASHEGIQEE
jgi:hypothetical protein